MEGVPEQILSVRKMQFGNEMIVYLGGLSRAGTRSVGRPTCSAFRRTLPTLSCKGKN